MVERNGTDEFEYSSITKSKFVEEYSTLRQIIMLLEKQNENPKELIALAKSMLKK